MVQAPLQDGGERPELCESVVEQFVPLCRPWFLFPHFRVMRRSSIPLCSGIALYLLRLLSMEIPFWDFAALAFIVEVSLMASAASLSCLPVLWMVPVPCAAVWAQPCVVPGSCQAGSPFTALCFSGPGVLGRD